MRATYEAERHRGLAAYCAPDAGYQAGRRGERYLGVCPKFPTDFHTAYQHGLRYYELQEEIFLLEDKLFELESRRKPGTTDQISRQRLFRLEDRLTILEQRLRRYASWPPRLAIEE